MRATGPEALTAPEAVIDEVLARAAAPPSALRHLAQLAGHVVVVKYGGAAMVAPEKAERWARDLVLLCDVGIRPLVVHGGGPALTKAMARMGIETSFIDGHRVTNADAAEVAEMVLSGRVNKQVVSLLQRAGGRAVGLSGTDGGMIVVGRHRPGGADLGFVGKVEALDTGLLWLLLENGYIPVLSSTAADPSGQPHNINADVVTGAVAGAVGATEAVFLSDVPGVIVDGELRRSLTASEAASLVAAGVAGGGMRPKLEAAVAALGAGVGRVHLIDGRERHALLREILSDRGIGTIVIPDPEEGVLP
jgi:acetylglutamate kinase